MKIVYVLQIADTWLNKYSERSIAVCSSIEEPLTEHDLYLLQNFRHTQSRDNNYIITAMTLNKLYEQ